MLPEAIILAITGSINAICQVALEAMKGQTPEQREKFWAMFLKDVEAWRAFWGIDPK